MSDDVEAVEATEKPVRRSRHDPAQNELRAVRSELARTRRRHEELLLNLGALEERVEAQAAELARRRTQVEELARGSGPRDALAPDEPRRWTSAGAGAEGFWRIPVALTEINRRITGSTTRHPDLHFRDRHASAGPLASAVLLGDGLAPTVRRFARLRIAERLTLIQPTAEALAAAARDSRGLGATVEVVAGDLRTSSQADAVDLLAVRASMAGVDDLDEWATAAAGVLKPGGLLYLDDYLPGPAGSAPPAQLDIVQRVFDGLSPALRRDLVVDDGRARTSIVRATEDAASARRTDDVLAAVQRHFEPVELVPYGGGLFVPLLDGVAGNFAGNDDLVRVLMELDFLLTDAGLLDTAYVWSVWRRR